MNIKMTKLSRWFMIPLLFLVAAATRQTAEAQIPVRWTKGVAPPSREALEAKAKAALRVSRAGGMRVRVVAGQYKTILNLSRDVSDALTRMIHWIRVGDYQEVP